MEQTRGYRDLIAWQKGIKLVRPVYLLARKLPKDEQFELSSQIRKAVVSISANIAEGQARRGAGEFLYHLGVARGSLAELDTLLEACVEVEYFTRRAIAGIVEAMSEVRRILQGLISSVERHSGLRCQDNSYRAWLASMSSARAAIPPSAAC